MRGSGGIAAVVAAALLALLAPPAAAAGDAPGARAPLELRVNGVDRGEVVALVGDGGDVWLPVRDLEAAGLRAFGGERVELDGVPHVALRSLAPHATFALDERALRVDVTADRELLGRFTVDLAPTRPAEVVAAREPSAFLNYALRGDGNLRPSFSTELGAGDGRLLLLTALGGAPETGVVRGTSSATLDEPERLRRWTVGDAAVSLGGLGSSGLVGGLGVARDFSLDPYFVQAPRPATTAFASSPSTLEVYLNDVLVRRQEIAPGTIDLANLPLTTGPNAVRTVLRDAYGREQTFDLRAAYAAGLLGTGVSDYAYHVGFLRGDLTRSFEYGRPVALARHRLGLRDDVTAGARLEAGLDRVSGGPALSLGTPVGEVDAEVAGSVARGRPGAAAALAWSWTERRLSGGLRLRGATARATTAVLDLAADRALADASAFLSVRATNRLTLGADVSAARWRDAGDLATVGARADVALAPGLLLLASATATRDRYGATSLSGQVLLSWTAGARTSAQVAASAGGDGVGVSAGAQRSLPLGPGYGYRVEADAGARRGAADLQWQTAYGRYEATLERSGAAQGGTVSAAGGLVLIGGRAFAARPVETSFGLIRAGVPDVRGYLENQEVGRTDSRGDLLVPALQPRYANRLGLSVSDIPMDYEVAKAELLLAPPLKRGAIARFPVAPVRAVTGRVEVDRGDGPAPAALGAIEVSDAGGRRTSATTSEGRFFLEGVAPGAHEAEVSWAEGTCRFTLQVPAAPGVQDVGAVRCAPEATASLAP